MSEPTRPITVYYDGACPLCRREIALLRRATPPGAALFEDVSAPDARPSCPLPARRLRARFHAKLANGEIVSGARAFTEIWSRARGLGWVARLGRWAPTRAALDALYAGFLRIRPALQRLAAAREP